MQKYDFDDNISDTTVRCALGINKRTGRLQWCPGFCNLSRMLIITSIIMVPICLLFFLFTHVSFVKTVSDGKFPNDYRRAIKTREIQTPLCRIVPRELSETVLIEEREILKDIRTSFVPNDLIVIPPNCKNSDDDLNVENNENDINEETKISEFLKRRRRRSRESNETSEMIIDSIDNGSHSKNEYNFNDDEDDDGDDDNIEESRWKISNECQPSSEMDGSEKIYLKKCDTTSSKSFHSFWKGEGSPDVIRSTQAEIMKKYMDTSVKPCDDFYQYACGNWEKLNPIPEDKATYDTFEILRESLDTVLRDLLNSNDSMSSKPDIPNISALIKKLSTHQNSSPDEKSSQLRRNIFRQRRDLKVIMKKYKKLRHVRSTIQNAEIKAKHLYRSCMNYATIEKRGLEPLHTVLKRIGEGGWPLLDPNWTESQFNWLELIAKLRLYNNDILIAEWVSPDMKNSEQNIIQFDQTTLGLQTRDYFLHESNIQYLNAYEEYMATIIKLIGSNSTNATQEAKEIVNFEKQLANITSSTEERTDVSALYSRMNLKSLHKLIPQIDWIRYLTVVLERPVSPDEMVVMFATKYMQNLVELLSRTEKRTVANYIFWRFVRHRINNMDDRFLEAKQKFYKVLFGREKSPSRWKNCVSQVKIDSFFFTILILSENMNHIPQ